MSSSVNAVSKHLQTNDSWEKASKRACLRALNHVDSKCLCSLNAGTLQIRCNSQMCSFVDSSWDFEVWSLTYLSDTRESTDTQSGIWKNHLINVAVSQYDLFLLMESFVVSWSFIIYTQVFPDWNLYALPYLLLVVVNNVLLFQVSFILPLYKTYFLHDHRPIRYENFLHVKFNISFVSNNVFHFQFNHLTLSIAIFHFSQLYYRTYSRMQSWHLKV